MKNKADATFADLQCISKMLFDNKTPYLTIKHVLAVFCPIDTL